ncbi:hypothetical protein CCAX7_44520 [Capsulimonas corticalis]|uniref:Uncharacterized protein n=1 Tax=Capsulimonas corticalis TaxID=2219043 RepID=A0A402CX89_9BACT|nr:hypothetical protein [Capsulimonas corticalis]BDI32401.1 hypothetical protein CCAX7_44520 [Capsulimonas corticalis]
MSPTLHHILSPIVLFGALGTIAILSLVFKENKFYRLFEHIFLGLALGYEVEQDWTKILRPQFWDPMMHDGQWAWVLTIPVGLMFYGIYTQRFAWMSRLLFGVFFGLTAGTVFQDFGQRFMPQVTKSFKPLVPPPPKIGDHHALLHQISFVVNNALFMVILVSVIVYFFFAFEQKNKAVLGTARFGRFVLMFAFGAIFGSTIMTRMALLIDRMYFLFVEWLRIAPQ